jgi:hypothetical protein
MQQREVEEIDIEYDWQSDIEHRALIEANAFRMPTRVVVGALDRAAWTFKLGCLSGVSACRTSRIGWPRAGHTN